jgi:two-component system response regulator (stage 0 sporulation protein A)
MDKFKLETYNALRQLEIPAHMRGYQYIKTAMNIINENPSAIYAIIKLYEAIAEKENTTHTRVERGIRHALSQCHTDFAKQNEVLGTARELKNGEFLATLFEVIKVKLAGVA